MKVFRILLVLTVLGALAVHFGWLRLEFYFYTVPWSDETAAASSTPSRDLEDVLALRRAAVGGRASAQVAAYRLLDRASALGRRPGAALIERRLPWLASRADRELPLAQARVRAVGVQSMVGWTCREAALRLLGRERGLFRALAADVAGTEPTWRAVDRFGARVDALQRWYAGALRASCLAEASAQDRAAVRRAMHQF